MSPLRASGSQQPSDPPAVRSAAGLTQARRPAPGTAPGRFGRRPSCARSSTAFGFRAGSNNRGAPTALERQRCRDLALTLIVNRRLVHPRGQLARIRRRNRLGPAVRRAHHRLVSGTNRLAPQPLVSSLSGTCVPRFQPRFGRRHPDSRIRAVGLSCGLFCALIYVRLRAAGVALKAGNG